MQQLEHADLQDIGYNGSPLKGILNLNQFKTHICWKIKRKQ